MHSLFIASCNSLCILLISENVLVLTKYACAEIWKSKKNTFLGANEVPTPHKGGASFSLPLHSKLARENIANIFFFIML